MILLCDEDEKTNEAGEFNVDKGVDVVVYANNDNKSSEVADVGKVNGINAIDFGQHVCLCYRGQQSQRGHYDAHKLNEPN